MWQINVTILKVFKLELNTAIVISLIQNPLGGYFWRKLKTKKKRNHNISENKSKKLM